jgi:hypothetical protein
MSDGTVSISRSSPAQNAWVQRVLKVAIGSPPGGAPGLVALQTSRLAWDNFRKNAQSQLRALEASITQAVAAHNADDAAEDEYDDGDVASGVRALYGILDKLDARLIDKLDQALGVEGPARQKLHDEAAGIVREYQAVVDADPLLGKIDVNGFSNTTIHASAQQTLAELARQL